MKKVITLCVLVAIGAGAFAQDDHCLKIKTGATWEVDILTAKGKPSERLVHQVSRLDSAGGKFTMTIGVKVLDAKGKKLRKYSWIQYCDRDTLHIDMKQYFLQRDNLSYKWETLPSFASFPVNMQVGQTLQQASVTYTAIKTPQFASQVGPAKNNQIGAEVSYVLDERKVESIEDVVTPAGTLKAYKIQSKATHRSELDNNVPVEYKIVEWFVPAVGIVKSELYKKDKMVSSALLKKKNF